MKKKLLCYDADNPVGVDSNGVLVPSKYDGQELYGEIIIDKGPIIDIQAVKDTGGTWVKGIGFESIEDDLSYSILKMPGCYINNKTTANRDLPRFQLVNYNDNHEIVNVTNLCDSATQNLTLLDDVNIKFSNNGRIILDVSKLSDSDKELFPEPGYYVNCEAYTTSAYVQVNMVYHHPVLPTFIDINVFRYANLAKLNTSDKTVIGAINELKAAIDELKTSATTE